MNVRSAEDTAHPHYVSIPDPERSEGVRAYREPVEPHPLQLVFLDAGAEREWVEGLRTLLSSGDAAEADRRLSAELAGFDGALARLCRNTPATDVEIEGWDDLDPILSEWEGPPVTAITLGLTNPPDLAFETGRTHEPELLLGLYSDEAFPFCETSSGALLDECARETPGWVSAEEDIEFHCSVAGLGALNTALVHCKHRYFLRDGRDGVQGRAPGGYVEFVLASWLLSTRFLQAIEKAVATHGLPNGCRLIAGAIDVNADFATVIGGEPLSPSSDVATNSRGQPEFAPLKVAAWVSRPDPTIDQPESGPRLRQRIAPTATSEEEPPRRGFIARFLSIFARP